MKVGILGGTFDPVHNAHLAMAAAALEGLKLDRVVWMPTGKPPYRALPQASAKHRLAMLRLALAGEQRYLIDERELADTASGYTVDSLQALKEKYGDQAVLYLIMGADQYAKLASWHRPEEVKRLARIAVFARPGFTLQKGDAEVVQMQPAAVSASQIREHVSRGDDIDALVPAAVANYIRREGLYS